MTRNTSLHKLKFGKDSVTFRDLNVQEVAFLQNIKNESVRNEMAAKASMIDPEQNLPWPILQQVGERALTHSTKVTTDKQLFEITVRECRDKLAIDTDLSLISHIIRIFPGESVVELLKLTHKDLIELVCLAESMTNSQIFTIKGSPVRKKKGVKLVNPHELPDDGKGLQDKMNELNSMLGYGKP